MTVEITRIVIDQPQGNLFTETEGIDVDASTRKYVELVENALNERFPGAEVELNIQYGCEGAAREPRVFLADGDWDESLAETVSSIQGEVWQGFEWVVYEG